MSNNRKKLDEEFEKVMVVGEGTVKQAKQILQDEQKESKEARNKVISVIDSKSKNSTFKTYYQLISDLLLKRIRAVVDFPQGWRADTVATKEGVVVELYYAGRIWRLGFKPTGLAKYDLNAIDNFCMRVENTIQKNEPRSITIIN